MNSALHFDIPNDADTCQQLLFERGIVAYLLRNFFDELKEISIRIIMSDQRICDVFFKVRPVRRWGGSIMNGFGQGIYAPGMKDQRTAQSYFSAHG